MAGDLPTGTVTFLFTDIEGSTRLWEEQPAAMASALERHDAIVRSAVERAGHVFATGGDGFGAVFQRAEWALEAAVEAQRHLVAEPWPETCPIGVRMGLHSGETHERDGDYFGPTVNRCARIMSAARPAQILVSETTRSVLSEAGLSGVDLALAGEARLRGTADPVALYRVVADGLPVAHGALREIERGGNVVSPLTSFVGRDDELAGLLGALDRHRLVTLIGVGGVGKTRLAIEAVMEARGNRDGVWLVELGKIDSSEDVAAAVSEALRLRPGPDFADSVVQWCASRDLLVLLDNCEHVLPGAATLVASLVAAAPEVKVLATSREPLMVMGEHVVPVPSLALDGAGDDLGGAVTLFVDRARAELPGFDISGHEEAVRDICVRLDGIPLALELAAARVRGLPLVEISNRLDERFRLLTGGRSGSVERHATLRAAVEWSYELLEPAERDLFERLSVFAGRFGVGDAVGLVGDDVDEYQVIDTLSALVDRSLVVRDDQVPEYRLLETLRAYGRERLAGTDRIDQVRADHAVLMASKAQRSRVEAAGPQERTIAGLLAAQLSDYGAATDWAIGAGRPELAVAIGEDCLITDWGVEEPGRWVAALIGAPDLPDPVLAGACTLAAHHALFFENDPGRGTDLIRKALSLDPTRSMTHAQAVVADLFSGRVDTVVGHAESALEAAKDDADRHLALLLLGYGLLVTGRNVEAAAVVNDLHDLGRSRRYPSAIASAHYLSGVLLAADAPTRALAEFSAGLEALGAGGDWTMRVNLQRETIPVLMRIDPTAAVPAAAELLEVCDARNDTGQARNALAYLVTIIRDLGAPELGAKIAGHLGDHVLSPTDTVQYHATNEALREQLGEVYLDHAEAGSRSPTKRIVEEALAFLGPHRGGASAPT